MVKTVNSHVDKPHLSKKKLENIFKIYRFCLQAHNSQDKDVLNVKFTQIVEEAEKNIRDFAQGNLVVEQDALDLMAEYIKEFGQNYYRKDGKLVYQYSEEAEKANFILSKLVLYKNSAKAHANSQKVQASKIETTPKCEQTNAQSISKRVLPNVNATPKREVLNAQLISTRALPNVNVAPKREVPNAQSSSKPVLPRVQKKENSRKSSNITKVLAPTDTKKTLKTCWNKLCQKSAQKTDVFFSMLKHKACQYGLAAAAFCGVSAMTLSSSTSLFVSNDKMVKETFDKSKKQRLSAQLNNMIDAQRNQQALSARLYNTAATRSEQQPLSARLNNTIVSRAEPQTLSVRLHNTVPTRVEQQPLPTNLNDTIVSRAEPQTLSAQLNEEIEINKDVIDTPFVTPFNQSYPLVREDTVVAQKKVEEFETPYNAAYLNVLNKNKTDYQHFVQNVRQQFIHNIKFLNNSNKRQKMEFYRKQGQYLADIGKSQYIIPKKSCESMSAATLLSVAQNSNSNNYINQACRDILKNIPNPHACYSSMNALGTQKTNNLGKEICQIFDKNPNAIIAAWIHNSKGGRHRLSFIGTGDGQAYMVAYNNDRIRKVDRNHLGWLNNLSGEYHNISENIIRTANEMAIKAEQEKIKQQNKEQSDKLTSMIFYKNQESFVHL